MTPSSAPLFQSLAARALGSVEEDTLGVAGAA